MKTAIFICIICISSLCFSQDDNDEKRHPGFKECVSEREALLKEIGRYRSIEIHDQRVLEALRTVPRHLFVPEEIRSYAYKNNPLPIGYNQTISQPVIVASMTQMLDVKEGEKILEIGTGSGYQAAVLAELNCEVYSIEIVPELGQRSKALLAELGYKNVHVMIGDGYEGWSKHAPYDKIIVTCAPEEVPQALIDQLAPTGKIVVPVGGVYKIQYLVILTFSKKGKLITDYRYPVRFVPMTGQAQEK